MPNTPQPSSPVVADIYGAVLASLPASYRMRVAAYGHIFTVSTVEVQNHDLHRRTRSEGEIREYW